MEHYSIREAQDQLPQLINDARRGKTILIMDEHDQVVQLVPVPMPAKPRQAGSARGLITITTDFDAPIADLDEYSA